MTGNKSSCSSSFSPSSTQFSSSLVSRTAVPVVLSRHLIGRSRIFWRKEDVSKKEVSKGEVSKEEVLKEEVSKEDVGGWRFRRRRKLRSLHML
jgi:hypothetical protein